jgi:type VI secretion system protein ImpI
LPNAGQPIQHTTANIPQQSPLRGPPETRAPQNAQPPVSHPTPAPDFVAAFCQGAGLDPSLAKGVDGEALAYALGQVACAATNEIMRMLQDRANVKQFTRVGDRTLLSATANNPMKFLGEPNQVLEVMFLRGRDGFMSGPDGFENSLKDLRAHQTAVFAALQPALAAVLAGLSPEDIEASEPSGNMLGGSRKGKLWDNFVQRWDRKANSGDHGMLDEFLKAFANAYAEAVRRDIRS